MQHAQCCMPGRHDFPDLAHACKPCTALLGVLGQHLLPAKQVQVADIGLMGGPAKYNGRAVEGVRIFKGGSVGEGAELAAEFEKGVACNEDVLLPKLRDMLINDFGAKAKAEVLQAA